MKTIEEKNRLIAEFMGVNKNDNGTYEFPQFGSIRPNGYFKTEFENYQLKYHTSWDWLMPVVSKITNQEKYIGLMHRENIMDTVPYGMIDDTYSYVVEFIEWYNEQNKSLKVGDRVLFTIDRKVFVDVITYIDNETIEGEKYDLTIQKLTKI